MSPVDSFELSVQKLIAASAYSSFVLQVARELFGQSYFALGVEARAAVDQAALRMVMPNVAGITPALFVNPTPSNPAGFQTPPLGSKTTA